MKYNVIYTDRAKADRNEIIFYLSGFYLSTVKKFLTAIDRYVSILYDNPYAFKQCEYNSEYRQIAVSDYIVFYKVREEAKTVEIHRILRGARNAESEIT